MNLEPLFATILVPGRWMMEAVGLHPIDIQVWALMVAVFMFALMASTTYGDFVLRRRQRRATGTVVSIDDSDDVSTPRIAFSDANGRRYEFDSPLNLTSRTSKVGGTVEVIYDPQNPRRAREANRVLMRIAIAAMWYGFAIWLAAYAVAGDAVAGGDGAFG